MDCRTLLTVLCLSIALVCSGCQSPYYADQGALFGGVTGAGVGALVGHAVGSTGAGAAIGAGVGAVTGGVVGQSLDNIEARNRAMIEARLGRPVGPGAVTIDDVVAMSRAGVDPELIIAHIQSNGVARPLTSSDLIYLQQQQVNPRVVQTMESPPAPTAAPVVVRQAPPPVIIQEYPYDPWWGPRPYYYYPHGCYHRPPPHIGWGVSVTNIH